MIGSPSRVDPRRPLRVGYQLPEAEYVIGRDPASVERTVAVLRALEDRPVIRDFDRETCEPLRGSPEEVAVALRAYAAAGIAEVQLVIDPNTPAGMERLVPILEHLDRGG